MDHKACFKCGERKPLADFYAHRGMADGRLNKCKECTKRDVRLHRRENPEAVRERDRLRFVGARRSKTRERVAEYAARYPERVRANNAVGNAIRAGKLRRLPCEACGRPDSHGHHDDYSKPLDVRWLCPVHHAEAHGRVVSA